MLLYKNFVVVELAIHAFRMLLVMHVCVSINSAGEMKPLQSKNMYINNWVHGKTSGLQTIHW